MKPAKHYSAGTILFWGAISLICLRRCWIRVDRLTQHGLNPRAIRICQSAESWWRRSWVTACWLPFPADSIHISMMASKSGCRCHTAISTHSFCVRPQARQMHLRDRRSTVTSRACDQSVTASPLNFHSPLFRRSASRSIVGTTFPFTGTLFTNDHTAITAKQRRLESAKQSLYTITRNWWHRRTPVEQEFIDIWLRRQADSGSAVCS